MTIFWFALLRVTKGMYLLQERNKVNHRKCDLYIYCNSLLGVVYLFITPKKLHIDLKQQPLCNALLVSPCFVAAFFCPIYTTEISWTSWRLRHDISTGEKAVFAAEPMCFISSCDNLNCHPNQETVQHVRLNVQNIDCLQKTGTDVVKKILVVVLLLLVFCHAVIGRCFL